MERRKFHWRMLYRPMHPDARRWAMGMVLGYLLTWVLLDFVLNIV